MKRGPLLSPCYIWGYRAPGAQARDIELMNDETKFKSRLIWLQLPHSAAPWHRLRPGSPCHLKKSTFSLFQLVTMPHRAFQHVEGQVGPSPPQQMSGDLHIQRNVPVPGRKVPNSFHYTTVTVHWPPLKYTGAILLFYRWKIGEMLKDWEVSFHVNQKVNWMGVEGIGRGRWEAGREAAEKYLWHQGE